MNYIGIDPGKNGGVALIRDYADWPAAGLETKPEMLALKHYTPHDLAEFLHLESCRELPMRAVIEKVASSPQMGVVSAFTFGQGYGFWLGCLSALKIPYAFVTPQKWQKALGCLSKGDKNVTKAKAQQLYPGEKITHATADALLLATYCKQNHGQLF